MGPGRPLARRRLGYELGPLFLVTNVRSWSPNISLFQFLNLWEQVKLASILGPQEVEGGSNETPETPATTANSLSGENDCPDVQTNHTTLKAAMAALTRMYKYINTNDNSSPTML